MQLQFWSSSELVLHFSLEGWSCFAVSTSTIQDLRGQSFASRSCSVEQTD